MICCCGSTEAAKETCDRSMNLPRTPIRHHFAYTIKSICSRHLQMAATEIVCVKMRYAHGLHIVQGLLIT